MNVENGTPNRGAVLLAELKALVDSFPPQRRAYVIRTLESVFRGLNAAYHGRPSFDLGPKSKSVLDPPSSKPQTRPDSNDELQNKNRE